MTVQSKVTHFTELSLLVIDGDVVIYKNKYKLNNTEKDEKERKYFWVYWLDIRTGIA
jgi:hypothetical protein